MVWNGRQPATQLVELSVDKSSALAAVTSEPEFGKLKNLPRVEAVARKRLVETVKTEDSNPWLSVIGKV
jgi:hypothetical protein